MKEIKTMTKNTFQRTALIVAFAASTLALSACQNLSSPTVRFDRQVNYGDAKGVELVTNEFGSSDLQMIAEKMTGSLLETGIFQGRPTVTISTVKNKTSEYIDTTNVMNSIQTAAKYQLEGELTSIVKQNNTTKDVFYKFTLKMFDVQEGTIEWQDEKEIRKTSKR